MSRLRHVRRGSVGGISIQPFGSGMAPVSQPAATLATNPHTLTNGGTVNDHTPD